MFVSAKQCTIPDGYLKRRGITSEVDRKKAIIQKRYATSVYKKRMDYDDNQKQIGGSSVPMPTQQDFMKLKIEEKERLLQTMIEEGKKELIMKRQKDYEEQEFGNPYEHIVRKVELR